MSNIGLEAQQEYYQVQQKRNSQRSKKGLTGLLISLVLWGGLAYGGYWLANQYIKESRAYIDTQLTQVEEQNQKHMDDLQIKIDELYVELQGVESELALIQEDLALTGESLNGSDDTKVALQSRIDELNKQLKALQTSIQKLEDAAR